MKSEGRRKANDWSSILSPALISRQMGNLFFASGLAMRLPWQSAFGTS
jgi:hypothetical protein